jgi:glucose-1-phosphate thymidylyltransferase
MKGIILAGGTGSRLWPITRSVSKQLLAVYDKPMIYYPISTLMLAGIQDILIITTPQDQTQFQVLLGDGSDIGISFHYATQSEPRGLAEAFIIGEEFLSGDSCLMILGDNIFHGAGLGRDIVRELPLRGGHVFTYEVSDPSDYGVLEIDEGGKPISVHEKPQVFISNLAVTGLYFFDSRISDFARNVTLSDRGELEITSVIEKYLEIGELTFTNLSRGSVWLDTGNPNRLSDAGLYIKVIEERTGLKIACLEEVAVNMGFIDLQKFRDLIKKYGSNQYADYLLRIARELSN